MLTIEKGEQIAYIIQYNNITTLLNVYFISERCHVITS